MCFGLVRLFFRGERKKKKRTKKKKTPTATAEKRKKQRFDAVVKHRKKFAKSLSLSVSNAFKYTSDTSRGKKGRNGSERGGVATRVYFFVADAATKLKKRRRFAFEQKKTKNAPAGIRYAAPPGPPVFFSCV